MHPSTSILLCGSDPMLLETRRMVLDRAGYRVLTAADPAEVTHLASIEPMEMLILCHSLTPLQKEQAVAAALSLKPGISVMVLAAFFDRGSLEVAECRTWSNSRPTDLLAAVAEATMHAHPLPTSATKSQVLSP